VTDADVLEMDVYLARTLEQQVQATSDERIARARLNLEYTRIRAPISGRIGRALDSTDLPIPASAARSWMQLSSILPEIASGFDCEAWYRCRLMPKFIRRLDNVFVAAEKAGSKPAAKNKRPFRSETPRQLERTSTAARKRS
jgi:multidrug efflux pump subunit AcrA (membrane-fusion protein)